MAARSWKPWAQWIAATAGFVVVLALSGCGGGSSGSPALVSIALSGVPSGALAPGQSAQLTATAHYTDGSDRDVTPAASWTTSAANVAGVVAGRVTALAPGRFDIAASFEGAAATLALQVVALPAAYFRGELEYAFDYELDAQGRVKNYRISRRPDVDYGSAPWQGGLEEECRGNLRESYECVGSYRSMRGEGGRLVRAGFDPGNVGASGGYPNYTYGPNGLSGVSFAWQGPTSHEAGDATVVLSYDGAGRLAVVTEQQRYGSIGGVRGSTVTARITVDTTGRMVQAEIVCEPLQFADDCANPTSLVSWRPFADRWTYDANGFMSSAGTTAYVADAGGWLLSRSVPGSPTNTYAVVRYEGRVVEETFTRAEPRRFYYLGVPQRVRYEWGRLPSEPLFVPRAPTGLDGADFFGVISSHHR